MGPFFTTRVAKLDFTLPRARTGVFFWKIAGKSAIKCHKYDGIQRNYKESGGIINNRQLRGFIRKNRR